MIKRLLIVVLLLSVILAGGCVKETYDMSRLSTRGRLSPTLAVKAVTGGISFSDFVKSGDTVVFEQDKFVKIIFKEDSVINLKMEDLYDFENLVSFSQSYELGVLSISPFEGNIGITLSEIVKYFPKWLRNDFDLLDDGAKHIFPPVPSVDLDDIPIDPFPGFENAVFESGYIDISVTNNLTSTLGELNIGLFNSIGRSEIGTVTIQSVDPAQTRLSSIDLANKSVTNSIIAAISLSMNPDPSTPVIISLNNSNIEVKVKGRDLRIRSGRVILPEQIITTLDNVDTVDFDPDNGIEIDEIKISKGSLTYHLQSTIALAASLEVTLPSTDRGGDPVSEVINLEIGSDSDGNIPFDGTIIYLNSDQDHPFNSIPLHYTLDVGSDNQMVDFNSTDYVMMDIRMPVPEFDYVKGYFGQQTETIQPDSIDLGIDEILSHISGEFLISDPSIRLDYSNSFGVPIDIYFSTTGFRGDKSVDLELDTISVAIPGFPVSRDIISSILIDKDNSQLPALISLPPEKIVFSGSASMNPSAGTVARDNYVFSNSRFLGSLEIQVPLQFSMNNLQFTDTLDNFLKANEDSSGNPLNVENFESLEIKITAKNGFPLGASLKMSLYDELDPDNKPVIEADSILKPAPVDLNGKSNGITESATTIKITRDFFEYVSKADKIIFWFNLNTTDNGSSDVKIYSDYRIDFNASLLLKPEIIFN